MVSAKPFTIGLNQSKIPIVWSISDWLDDLLNGFGAVQTLDRLPGLMMDYWFDSPTGGSIS